MSISKLSDSAFEKLMDKAERSMSKYPNLTVEEIMEIMNAASEAARKPKSGLLRSGYLL